MKTLRAIAWGAALVGTLFVVAFWLDGDPLERVECEASRALKGLRGWRL